MRRLILKMSMSIDGFVGGPEGQIDWIFKTNDDEAIAWTVAAIKDAGLHAMGSRTFRDMAAYWPTSTEVFAAPMNDIPKVVFARHGLPATTTRALDDARARAHGGSATPAFASWAAARVAAGELDAEVAALKREPGGDIVAHGGASFARSLVDHGLVDEYRLLVHPVALGRGLPIFSRPIDLQLVDCRAFRGGTVAHVYQPAKQ